MSKKRHDYFGNDSWVGSLLSVYLFDWVVFAWFWVVVT